jgi:hypothetical protein
MPDIADEDEGRPAMGSRQGAGVLLGLPLGVEHEHVPGAACPAASARFVRRRRRKRVLLAGDRLCAALQPALLRLQHKGVLFVKVDAADGFAAVLVLRDDALEDVVVALMGCVGGVGLLEAEDRDQLLEERNVVRPLLAALAALPAGDESLDGMLR